MLAIIIYIKKYKKRAFKNKAKVIVTTEVKITNYKITVSWSRADDWT